MADLEDKLNAILGNPEAMGQIMSIARSLSDTGDAADSDGQDAQPAPSSGEEPDGDTGGQTPNSEAVAALLSGLTGQPKAEHQSASGDSPLSALGSLDPKLIQIALQLFSAYSAEDDRRTGKAATATDRRGPRPQTRGEPPAPGGAKTRKGKASDKGSAAGHGPTTRGGPGPAGAQRGRAAARSGPSANTAATTTEPRHLHHRRAISARDEAPPGGEAQRGGPQAAEAP